MLDAVTPEMLQDLLPRLGLETLPPCFVHKGPPPNCELDVEVGLDFDITNPGYRLHYEAMPAKDMPLHDFAVQALCIDNGWVVCPLLRRAAGKVRDLRLEPCPPETEVIAFEFAISTLCEYAERLCHRAAASGHSTDEDAAVALHWAFELPAVAMRHDELDPSWDNGGPQLPRQCAEVLVWAFNAGCGESPIMGAGRF